MAAGLTPERRQVRATQLPSSRLRARRSRPGFSTAEPPVNVLAAPHRDGGGARRRPAAWMVVLLLAVIGTLLFAVTDNLVVKLSMEVGACVTSTSLLLAGWRRERRRGTGADPLVGLAAVSMLIYTVATVGFAGVPAALGVTLPVPSVVDAMFFLSYCLFAVFLWRLGSRSEPDGRHQFLDTLIVALGAMPVVWVRLVEPQLVGGRLSAAQVTYLAYPVFVSVLLGLTIRLAFRSHRISAPYLLLGGWIGLELSADLLFVDLGVAGHYVYGQPWQALWVLSAGCIGALVLHPRGRMLLQERRSEPLKRRTRLYILGGALIVPMCTLSIADETSERADVVCLAIGLLLVIAVCLRLSGLMVDVAEQQRSQLELRRLSDRLLHSAKHDPLTNLGNRALLNELLFDLQMRKNAVPTSVLLLDVDDFKLVNDSLGHAVGDLLLVEVARRIEQALSVGDCVGRLGGDEFVVILDDADAAKADEQAKRLLTSLAEPMLLGEVEVCVSVSIGIATSDEVRDGLNLLGAADMAMYLAKERGKAGSAVFVHDMQESANERLALEIDLRRALLRDELFLAYQPIVDLHTGELAGVEALVRWKHAAHGAVSPEVFIPIAEQTGLIVPLGAWVLRESVAQLKRWDRETPLSGLTVNVNVSTRQLERAGLLAVVDELIAEGLEPSRLVLEITETALTLNVDAVAVNLHELRARGVSLALDDFGTGYSSLSRLQASPVSQLKIDRSFVKEVRPGACPAPILDATVAMAHGLGLNVVAEGVETPAQLRYLQELGCAHAQGYLLAHPQDPHGISELLTSISPWGELLTCDAAGREVRAR